MRRNGHAWTSPAEHRSQDRGVGVIGISERDATTTSTRLRLTNRGDTVWHQYLFRVTFSPRQHRSGRQEEGESLIRMFYLTSNNTCNADINHGGLRVANIQGVVTDRQEHKTRPSVSEQSDKLASSLLTASPLSPSPPSQRAPSHMRCLDSCRFERTIDVCLPPRKEHSRLLAAPPFRLDQSGRPLTYPLLSPAVATKDVRHRRHWPLRCWRARGAVLRSLGMPCLLSASTGRH